VIREWKLDKTDGEFRGLVYTDDSLISLDCNSINRRYHEHSSTKKSLVIPGCNKIHCAEFDENIDGDRKIAYILGEFPKDCCGHSPTLVADVQSGVHYDPCMTQHPKKPNFDAWPVLKILKWDFIQEEFQLCDPGVSGISYTIKLTPDCKLLVITAYDQEARSVQIKGYQTEDLKETFSFTSDHNSPITCLKFDEKGIYLLYAHLENPIGLYNIRSKRVCNKNLINDESCPTHDRFRFLSLDLTSDGKFLITSNKNRVIVHPLDLHQSKGKTFDQTMALDDIERPALNTAKEKGRWGIFQVKKC
jgi:WD40 repeat protein